MKIKEFKINEHLTLKLEWDNKTYIYVNEELFMHCKYLLLNIPVDEVLLLNDVNSIDDAEVKLDKSLELPETSQDIQIDPETEFWAHCSNLQAWYEYDYDTRLLHRNLAFPLLSRLAKVGDKLAIIALKEEIAERLSSGNETVVEFLINEGYIDYLSHEEQIVSVLNPLEAETILELEQFTSKPFLQAGSWMYFDSGIFIEPQQQFLVRNKSVIALLILWLDRPAKRLPESIGNFKNIEILRYVGENIIELPNSISKLSNLKELSIESETLVKLPENITNLHNLENLRVTSSCLNEIPDSLGNLSKLISLSISSERLINLKLPNSIKNLNKLENFVLSYIFLETFPEFFKSLVNLKKIDITYSHLKELPKYINKLKNLEMLYLRGNKINYIPESIIILENLKYLYINGNNNLDDNSKEILKKLKNKGIDVRV